MLILKLNNNNIHIYIAVFSSLKNLILPCPSHLLYKAQVLFMYICLMCNRLSQVVHSLDFLETVTYICCAVLFFLPSHDIILWSIPVTWKTHNIICLLYTKHYTESL